MVIPGDKVLDSRNDLESQFFPLFQYAAVGFAKVGLDCAWLRVNQKLCEITGYTEDELLARTFCDITHPDDLEADLANMRKVMGGDLDINVMEKRYIRKDGAIVWVHLTATLVRDAKGEPDYFITVIEDITLKKEAENIIRQSEERYRSIVDASYDGVWELDMLTNEVFWNDRLYEMHGLSRETYMPTWDSVLDLVHPDDRPGVQETLDNHIKHGAPFNVEIRKRHSSGNYMVYLVKGRVIRDESGTPIRMSGVHIDITERKQVENALKESEIRFRTMADATPLMIWVTDTTGLMNYVNQGWCDFLGMSAAEVIASGMRDAVHPEDISKSVGAYRDAFAEKTGFEVTCRLMRADGTYRWLMNKGAPLFSACGEFTGYIGSSMDVTEARQAQEELRLYAARLEQSNRELEQFATIASHDLQEPLRKVKMFSEMLAEHASDEGKDYAERVRKAICRMQDLISDLLLLSRVNRKGKPFRKLDLDKVLANVLNDLEVIIQETGASITASPLGQIQADEKQIEQVLQNLIGNALKFRRAGIQPVIRIQGESLGKEVEIRVEDNGIGLNEIYAERIFEPFERLHGKGQYPGTGMGLAICKKIVERHNGTITVESQPGAGAAFILRLPKKQLILEADGR